MKVNHIKAKKILCSNNKPSIEVTINKKYTASVPAGTSTGKNEVKAFTKSADFSAKFINEFKPLKKINISTFKELKEIEELQEFIGGNGVLAIQYALLRGLSKNKVWNFLNPKAESLPKPLGNCIGGGAHVKNGPDIQEFLLLPTSKKIKSNVVINNKIYLALKKRLKTKVKTLEGAWAPLLDTESILEILRDTCNKFEDKLKEKINLGLDVAASTFYQNGIYNYKNFSRKLKTTKLTKNEQIDYMNHLIKKYNLKYVEDPFQEEDFSSFSKLKNALICGDDLISTNINRLKKAKVSAVIIKPNQIGSINKTKEVVDYAKKQGIVPVISHRSGETMDPMISHLAVAWEIPIIKCGIAGKERKAKLNELIKIEKEVIQ